MSPRPRAGQQGLRSLLRVVAVLAACASVSPLGANAEPPADAGSAPADILPPIPDLPHYTEPPLPPPDAEGRQRLAGLMKQLLDAKPEVRFQARKVALALDESWLPAIAARLERHADGADKLSLKALLRDIRQQARDALREEMKAAGRQGKVVTPDYLEMLLSHEDRSSPHLEPLTEVVAISRMLEGIGTLPATRRLIDIYVRFGEFLRADTQLALTRLSDRSTAALVEATRHPAPRIAAWAEQRLERLGRSAPSDALQTLDPQIRADILRAYGAIGRLDTARLLISYAASENAEVRLAGRQAVTMLGAAALWQLRDAYEKTLGTRAPHEWPWDRVARELFGQFERQRLTDLYGLFNRGRAAQNGGDLAAARHAFDQVLTRDPEFAHAASLATFYFRFAQASADSDPEAALKALARAERLQPDGPLHQRTLSLRYTLEAEQLLKQHVVDEVLLLRARELDETNERAALMLARWATTQTPAQATWNRYLAAGIIAAVSALGLMVVLYRQRRERLKANTASPEL